MKDEREEQEKKATIEILKIAHEYWKWLTDNGCGISFSTFVNEFLEAGECQCYKYGLASQNLNVLYMRIKRIYATFYEEDFSII